MSGIGGSAAPAPLPSEREPGIAVRRAGAVGLARERVWTLTVWGAMLAWTAVLFAASRAQLADFGYARYDLGNMVQAVWSTAHGHPLAGTNGATGEQMSRLGSHVDPILVVLAPLWRVWPSALLLELVQIAALAAGTLPVLWLARRHLGSEKSACLLALAYLAYPWLSWVALESFHPVTLAIPLLLYCVWFLDGDRLVPFWICAVLALMTGELLGVTLAALGVWYALARGRRLVGASIAVAGAAWSAVALYVVIPAFSGGSSVFYSYYSTVGGSPRGLIRTAIADPGAILGMLFGSHSLLYLLWLGIPLVGLFLLAPGLAAVALPQLLQSGLSDFVSQTDPRFHYFAGALPFLVAATVLGIARLPDPRRTLAASVVLVVSTVLAAFVGTWPRAIANAAVGRDSVPPRHVEALRGAVAVVPAEARVSATNSLALRFSARRYVASVPIVGEAKWVAVDLRDPWAASPDSPLLLRRPAVVRSFAARLERDPRWTKVYEQDGVVVFRRLPGM